MLTPARVWAVLALLYVAFFSWYTSFGGPLTPEEIEHYVSILEQRGEPEDVALWRQFMETDTGDDFVMVNIVEMRETPQQVDGVQPGETSQEVLGRYTRPFLGRALLRASHPMFFGFAAADALDIWGIEGAEHWTNGALVRYRSRRDVMKQVETLSELGDDIHSFKIAAMERTIAFPVDPWVSPADPRLLLALLLVIAGLAYHLRHASRRAANPAC